MRALKPVLLAAGCWAMGILSVLGQEKVLTGAEQPSRYLPLIGGKRIGVVANPASVVNGVNTIDTLRAMGCIVQRIFSPEHGFRQTEGAGEAVDDTVDSVTGIPVTSLYGKKLKPDAGDLAGLELMVFDIQDVGVRFYTYISTLTYVMEACAVNKIPLIVLDRPNPNGFYIDGPVLEKGFGSFVGLHPVPVVYGMTIGEYAGMVNGEGWLPGGLRCTLHIIPLAGWTHQTLTRLTIPPSPNLTSMTAIYLYPSLCFFEGTVISVGRGTCFPFEVFGHPRLKGFSFSFVPESIPGMSLHPLYENERCFGLDLRDFYRSHPAMLGRINLAWLMMAFRDMESDPDFFTDYFGKLAGTGKLKTQIIQELPESKIREGWKEGTEEFKKIRGKYLLYP